MRVPMNSRCDHERRWPDGGPKQLSTARRPPMKRAAHMDAIPQPLPAWNASGNTVRRILPIIVFGRGLAAGRAASLFGTLDDSCCIFITYGIAQFVDLLYEVMD